VTTAWERHGWSIEAPCPSRPDRVVGRARGENGPPVVLKATLPAASWRDRATLRREGRLLARVAGDGVVELLDVLEARGRTALVLAFVATDLGRHPDVDLGPLAGTVDRLHRLGVTHGALCPDHVLLTADGRPVLCGFGAAGRAGGPGDQQRDEQALAALLLRRPGGGGRPRSPGGRPGGRSRP
jgi:hypothetical protein